MTPLYDDEISVHDGAPVELYTFVLDSVGTYRYVGRRTRALTVAGEVYEPATIRRGAISGGDVEQGSELVVEMAVDTPVVDDLLFEIPPSSIDLTIQRYHGNDANLGTIYQGPVQGVRLSGKVVSMRIPSVLEDAMGTPIPTVAYQASCNHFLYDDRCGLSRASFVQATTVYSVSPTLANVLTVADIGGAAANVYKGGVIQRTLTGERRLVLDQENVALTVRAIITFNRAFRSPMEVGEDVELVRGCGHTLQVCRDDFSNHLNYGGMPYIPSTNLFRFGIKGY